MRYRTLACLVIALCAGCEHGWLPWLDAWDYGKVREAVLVQSAEGQWVYCPAYVYVWVPDDGTRYVLDERGDYYEDMLALWVEASRDELEDAIDDGAVHEWVPEHERFTEISWAAAEARADFVLTYWPAQLVPVDEWLAGN